MMNDKNLDSGPSDRAIAQAFRELSDPAKGAGNPLDDFIYSVETRAAEIDNIEPPAGARDAVQHIAAFAAAYPTAYVLLRGPVNQFGESEWERKAGLYDGMKEVIEAAGFDSITACVAAAQAAQPAAPGAVEYDRELIARMLADYAFPDSVAGRAYTVDAINIQLVALRAADNRDAAGVHTATNAAATGMGDAMRDLAVRIREECANVADFGMSDLYCKTVLGEWADSIDKALAAQPAPVDPGTVAGASDSEHAEEVAQILASRGFHTAAATVRRLAAQPAPVVGGDGYVEQHARDSKELRRLCESRDFYKRRCDSLQAVQSNMRDPERKAVCGRCGCNMPLPDDFFAHSEDEEPEACPHCDGDGMDPGSDYLFECPHCLGDRLP